MTRRRYSGTRFGSSVGSRPGFGFGFGFGLIPRPPTVGASEGPPSLIDLFEFSNRSANRKTGETYVSV
jgi:hypothetical protein